MGRAPCCDKANVKRGPWSPEEDAKLKSYIEKHGTGGNWIALPQKIGLKRCGKSCRLRWLNYLRPNIKHGGFTEDEDNLICSLYISIGSRWSIIAAQLPGRTDNDIKNYWNTRLKKKLLGRQRREQQARRETKRGVENYSIGECFSPYNQPVSLFDTGFSNSIINTSLTPLLEPIFAYGHQNQNLGKNSTSTSYMNYSSTTLTHSDNISGVASNDFQAFDEIREDITYGMPQLLDAQEVSFSAVDVVNSSTVCTENAVSWGDMNGLGYTSALSNHGVCQRRMTQDWSVFDQLRLLGYTE